MAFTRAGSVNPGELKDSLIVLSKANSGIDENGFPIEGNQELFKLRCKKMTLSTREFNQADRESSTVTYKFIVRKRDIDNEMLIDYKGRMFNIKHVYEIDEFYLEIQADEAR